MSSALLNRPHSPASTSTPPGKKPPEGGMASVSKALLLLDALAAAGAPCGVSALARTAGMPKSTAFRLLSYLEASGLVERHGKDYQLGWRLFEMGHHVQACLDDGLRVVAAPYLTDLHARTQLAVHLSILEGTEVVCIDKVHGSRTPQVNSRIGDRLPANCTAPGKAIMSHLGPEALRALVEAGLGTCTPYSVRQPGLLLQHLREARARGYACDREESQIGVNCVSAAILRGGVPVAAVSVDGPTRPVAAETHATLVRETADAISRALQQD